MLRQYLGGNKKVQVSRALSISESGMSHCPLKPKSSQQGHLGVATEVGGWVEGGPMQAYLVGLGKSTNGDAHTISLNI